MAFGLGNIESTRIQTYDIRTQQVRGGSAIMGSPSAFIGGAKSVEKIGPTIVSQSPGAKTEGGTAGGLDWKTWAIIGGAFIAVAWLGKR